jgi:hypothetical protein
MERVAPCFSVRQRMLVMADDVASFLRLAVSPDVALQNTHFDVQYNHFRR